MVVCRAEWSAEQQKILEELAKLNTSAAVIAVAVGKTRYAVIGRARRKKVKLRDNPTRGTPDAFPCGHERTSENTKNVRYVSGPQQGKVIRRCLACYLFAHPNTVVARRKRST